MSQEENHNVNIYYLNNLKLWMFLTLLLLLFWWSVELCFEWKRCRTQLNFCFCVRVCRNAGDKGKDPTLETYFKWEENFDRLVWLILWRLFTNQANTLTSEVVKEKDLQRSCWVPWQKYSLTFQCDFAAYKAGK